MQHWTSCDGISHRRHVVLDYHTLYADTYIHTYIVNTDIFRTLIIHSICNFCDYTYEALLRQSCRRTMRINLYVESLLHRTRGLASTPRAEIHVCHTPNADLLPHPSEFDEPSTLKLPIMINTCRPPRLLLARRDGGRSAAYLEETNAEHL